MYQSLACISHVNYQINYNFWKSFITKISSYFFGLYWYQNLPEL